MTLWIILTAMAALVAALITVPLVRRQEARADARAATLAVLKDQLADVDVQLAAGTIPPGDAEGLRTEIKRRMLSAGHLSEDVARPFASRALSGVAVGLAAMVALAAAALYSTMGQPQLGSTPAGPATAAAGPQGAPPLPEQAEADAEITRLVTGLETKLAASPGDAEGWRMLGWSYYNLRRFDDAVRAYGKAVELNPNGEGYQSAYGEAMVQAADGQVTPAATAAFAKAAALDTQDARARYFLGIQKAQGGNLTGALEDWIRLLGDSAPDAPWVPQLRSIIDGTAKEAGVDVSARLAALRPPATGGASVASPAPPAVAAAAVGAPAGVLPGPSADQAAAVQALPPGQQQAMIRGMVDGLAERLEANPKDEAGWLRLMRARTVLREGVEARAARDAALAAFTGDASAQGRIRAAAQEMGIS
ncbi:cytochrome c-type biogenesis protein CycH [Polymorphobacter multimanifer]|uniref:Cytochrome c-type biogenesis protein CcmH n=1 Tax=Polymorphobacter multimanifer TaxID=1070431 RepID=A0A841L398_9SPHN|nr:c-type cytochrome biogenesis protein CcmI [Polymorphobacter multimanifer]MBB6227137.1 cytochrome c-type biogenesis protein CcmH [Polymorphobacter multimanifer]GGI70167.1 cytochrome c-type biogenesis protein CycH [Polymorphobacter multimanifer]